MPRFSLTASQYRSGFSVEVNPAAGFPNMHLHDDDFSWCDAAFRFYHVSRSKSRPFFVACVCRRPTD
jgi:hypothetical protein